MKNPHRFILEGGAWIHRSRILFAPLLAAFIVSIVATTTHHSATAGSAAHAAPIAAQTGFTITSPAESALVPCGQPITVTWTGGNPSDNVNLVLIDIQAYQVFQGFGVEPNTGSRVVTIGPGSCGRKSQFYVEDSPRTTWTYGPVFTVACSNTFNIADGDVAGLIAAISTANANSCPTTINLAPNGTYTLTAVADTGYPDYQASGAAGLPYVRGQLTINGNGATIKRSTAHGTPDFVILEVSGFTPAAQNGCQIGCVDATLNLNDVILMGGSRGGLHLTYATANVQNSTITENTGGGINNICSALNLMNSTVSYNTSDSAWGGGGIFFWGVSCAPGKPVANISFSTIFENSNPGWGRGNAIGTAYVVSPGGVFLKNSILASPSHPSEAVCNNGQGTLYSLGHNILGDATDVFGSRCYEALTAPGDMINTNPLLGPLANNGGPTPTHLPLECSPAVNAVPVADSTDTNGVPVTTDQRGISRPQGAASDIGAVEAVTRTHATKLFAVSRQGGDSTNQVFRYEVGPTGPPTLDLTMTHSSFDRPFGIVVSAAGELFIVNSGPESGGSGSVSRFLNAGASPMFNGAILSSSFNNPMLAAFRNRQLFIAQRFGAGALRFLFDGVGNASFNGAITSGLIPGYPRGVAVNPTTGELFVTECCGVNEINRYVFDSSGNAVPNGVITGGGLNNPHDLAFSPWGELFVVNSGGGGVLRVVFDNSGNATFNGQLTGNGLCNPIGLAFSPWGELFVSNHSCPSISRWVFDAAFNAIPNGSFSTPATLGDLEFLPGTEDQKQISCPLPITASADSNCQARVPNLLTDVTASGGCGGPVTLSQTPAAGTLVGLGTTTITVTATDAAHNSSTCTTTFTVADNTPPMITAPAGISVVDNAAGSCGASVNPGTPATSDNCGTVSVVGIRSDGKALTALYPVGATIITWTATDNSGNTASAQQNVMVTNPAPQVTIAGPSSGALYVVNTAVNFTGSFTDNAGDSHTAIWTFDSTPQTGIVNETMHTVSASHTFDSAGVYLVTLTITDDCGQTVATSQVGGFDALVVVYDPNAGFVTGGGWINSPAGAYALNPNLVGPANFGFVSKYQKGANVPDGQTEFNFKVANLNFHSTVYEWLVVAGAKAQYKGSGTINGSGNYGFMLTAIDGDMNGGGGKDKFRIKIWDKNNSDAVVYDNQMSAGIDDNPTTALAGGSIVIHK